MAAYPLLNFALILGPQNYVIHSLDALMSGFKGTDVVQNILIRYLKNIPNRVHRNHHQVLTSLLPLPPPPRQTLPTNNYPKGRRA